MISWFRRYLLPGFVFQSIIIAGGYGTGRELVEFFLRFGTLGGLLGMLLPAMVVVSITCAIAFELARLSGCYDYRSFLRQLLGRTHRRRGKSASRPALLERPSREWPGSPTRPAEPE